MDRVIPAIPNSIMEPGNAAGNQFDRERLDPLYSGGEKASRKGAKTQRFP